MLDILLIIFKLRETNDHKTERKVTRNPFPTFIRYFSQKKFLWILLSLLLIGVGTFSYQSILSILMEDRFGIPGVEIGYYLAGFGLFSVINQAVIIPKFRIKRFTNKTLLRVISIGMIPCMLIMALAGQRWLFALSRFMMVPFMSLMQAVYNSEIVQHTVKTQVGEMMGLL